MSKTAHAPLEDITAAAAAQLQLALKHTPLTHPHELLTLLGETAGVLIAAAAPVAHHTALIGNLVSHAEIGIRRGLAAVATVNAVERLN